MSTLAVDYAVLRREVGRMLAYGRDAVIWTSEQATDVADIMASGQRRMYWSAGHQWSFLRATTTLGLTAGVGDYDLPPDFVFLVGSIVYAAADPQPPLVVVPPSHVLAQRAGAALTGPPRYVAIRPKAYDALVGARREALFYPTPASAYSLTVHYAFEPPSLDSLNTQPVCGAAHGQTLLEACLAAAESTINDGEGVHEKRFQQCLAASIELDKAQGL